ncbi:MAG: hypothetical protein WBA67_16715 [Jannaschia sp.]
MAQIIIEKRRFAVLRHLYDTTGRELAPSILKAGCRAQGLPTDDDEMATALAWLEAQGLVTVSDLGPVKTARLKPAGIDVVMGHSEVAGILPFGDLV